jgi:ribosomal protein L7/L12
MDMPPWAVGGGLVLIGFVLGRLSVSRSANPGMPRTSAPLTGIDRANADAEIVACIQSGRKIDAIKRYRELHHVDLKSAKDAVDALEAQLPRS